MSPLLLLSWHCDSGHRHHVVVVVTVVWPCRRHSHSEVTLSLSLSSVVLWWDCDGGGLTVVVSVCHRHCHLSLPRHWPWVSHCHHCHQCCWWHLGAGRTIVVLALYQSLLHPRRHLILASVSSLLLHVWAVVVVDVREGGWWGQVGVREREGDSPFVIIILYVCCYGV